MSATAAFDLRQPAALEQELAGANRALARQAEVPAEVVGLVEALADAIAHGDNEEIAGINPWIWIRVQSAALRAQAALRSADPERRRQLRLALEQMRFLFARIADREPVGEDVPAGEVAHWLDRTLGSVSQPRKAALLGVSSRTYQRWISERDGAHPSAGDERRLRVVARLVNQLRHSLTGPGVIDWFEHPRADLDGRAPAAVLDDRVELQRLLAAAAASRGNLAA